MSGSELELLRAHNPVPEPDATIDPVARAAALDRALADVDSATPGGRRRRRRAWSPLAALIGPLVVAAAAVAASGILSGSPYDPPWAHERAGVDLGAPVPGTARLLSLRATDPAGGPAWGLRVVRTTRGYECVELGRVVDGRLGVLGQDGWFGNDSRFHPMPPSVFDNEACGLIGAGGFALAGTWGSTFASAIPVVGGCQFPGPKWTLDPRLPTCPARDQRFVAYGLAGPGAHEIAYTAGGARRILRTAGSDGAYLLVRPEKHLVVVHGSAAGGPGLAGGGGPGSFPGTTAVIYRDGRTCPAADPGPDTCVLSRFTTSPVLVRLHRVRVQVTLLPGAHEMPGTFGAILRFRVPVGISSGRMDYSFKAINPGVANSGVGNTLAGSLDRDVRRGSMLAWRVNVPACTRHVRLTIYLDGATAISMPWRLNDPAITTVATARVRLPAVRRVPWC